MLYTNDTETTKYVVIHSDSRLNCETCETVLLLELEPGSSIGTGQPHMETYDTYEEALEVAKTFGYIEPPADDDGQTL
jgi:hypothetical protein